MKIRQILELFVDSKEMLEYWISLDDIKNHLPEIILGCTV